MIPCTCEMFYRNSRITSRNWFSCVFVLSGTPLPSPPPLTMKPPSPPPPGEAAKHRYNRALTFGLICVASVLVTCAWATSLRCWKANLHVLIFFASILWCSHSKYAAQNSSLLHYIIKADRPITFTTWVRKFGISAFDSRWYKQALMSNTAEPILNPSDITYDKEHRWSKGWMNQYDPKHVVLDIPLCFLKILSLSYRFMRDHYSQHIVCNVEGDLGYICDVVPAPDN